MTRLLNSVYRREGAKGKQGQQGSARGWLDCTGLDCNGASWSGLYCTGLPPDCTVLAWMYIHLIGLSEWHQVQYLLMYWNECTVKCRGFGTGGSSECLRLPRALRFRAFLSPRVERDGKRCGGHDVITFFATGGLMKMAYFRLFCCSLRFPSCLRLWPIRAIPVCMRLLVFCNGDRPRGYRRYKSAISIWPAGMVLENVHTKLLIIVFILLCLYEYGV